MSTARLTMLCLALPLLSACAAPYRQEVRDQAKDRVNLVNAQLSYDQARQAFDSGRFDAAMRDIKQASERAPDQAPYDLLRGRIELETSKLEAALESFATAARKDPKLAEAHYFAGIVYQRWSNDTKAHDEYRQAFELEPSNVNYLLATAESLVAQERTDEARQLVESKLTYFEHNAAMRHLLGQIAMLQGDVATAARLYDEARLLNPDDNALLDELARVQYQAGLYGKSLQSIRLLTRRTKAQPEAMLLEARCLTALGRTSEARTIYLELTRTNETSSDPEVWIELGAAAWQLGDDRRVAMCGQQAVALAPDRYEGYLLQAVHEGLNGNAAREVLWLREAVARADGAALPHMLLGQKLEKDGDLDGARQCYAAVLCAQPDDPAARQLLAQLDGTWEDQQPDR